MPRATSGFRAAPPLRQLVPGSKPIHSFGAFTGLCLHLCGSPLREGEPDKTRNEVFLR
jgi:hypothetical protein